MAPYVLITSLQVLRQLKLTPESEQASQADKVMTAAGIVFKVVLQAPFVFEGAQTEVAEDFMALRVVHMVLQPVAIFEPPLAQIAIVLVQFWRLLDVYVEVHLAVKLASTNTAPVLMRILSLVAGN